MNAFDTYTYEQEIAAAARQLVEMLPQMQQDLLNTESITSPTYEAFRERVMAMRAILTTLEKDAKASAPMPEAEAQTTHMKARNKARLLSPLARKIIAQSHPCARCNATPNKRTVDHILPLSIGGSDDRSNLQVLCKACHKKKSLIDVRIYLEYIRLESSERQDAPESE